MTNGMPAHVSACLYNLVSLVLLQLAFLYCRVVFKAKYMSKKCFDYCDRFLPHTENRGCRLKIKILEF